MFARDRRRCGVFVQHNARSDISAPVGSIYTARFETGNHRYASMNSIQAFGEGVIEGASIATTCST